MSDIFISYRRKDSARDAKRIHEWLVAHFGAGSVFMDSSGIQPGEDFRATLRREIDSAKVMLVIIGKHWTFVENADGLQRLEEAHDVVRREIVIALESGMRVVPVLVSGAEIPQAAHLPAALLKLANLNAFSVGQQLFEDEMARLAEYIRMWIVQQPKTASQGTTGQLEVCPPKVQPPMIQKKICMVGAWGVGKTSLVRRYVTSLFSDTYLTTIGMKISKKHLKVGDTELTLMLWDLAGEEAATKLKPAQLRGSSGIILVTDGRNSSLATALDLREFCYSELGPVPIVLAANKVDLYDESWSWQYTLEALNEITENLGLTVFTTSAKTGKGVELMFQHVARKMLEDREDL
jgi:small GTP-binding protein